MIKKRRVAIVGSILLVGTLVGVAAAARSVEHGAAALTPGTYTIKATTLNAAQAVPKAKNAGSAKGSFSGTLKVAGGSKSTLTWKLTFAHLTGPALAAHIHLGGKGKAGRIVVPLCTPCKSGAHGTKPVTLVAAAALVAGSAYANVHTKLNPAGEIRGQLKATATGGVANPYANVVVTVTPALVAAGKGFSAQYSCEGCHTLTGANSTGPTWKGLAGKTVHLTTGQSVKADDGYLMWAIEQPDAQVVAGYSSGIMSTAIGSIPESQAKAMVAYIKSVK